MAIERIMQYECRVCGRKIDVTRTGDVYEEPVYCCGMEAGVVKTPDQFGLAAAAPKKPAAKKPAKKAAKKTVKKAQRSGKKESSEESGKKTAKKKAAKKAAKKKTAKKAVKKASKKAKREDNTSSQSS